LKNILLIGGAPLTGKTTLARKLAIEQNAAILSGDSVRSEMKKHVNETEYPSLFKTGDGGPESAENILKKWTPEAIVALEIEQAHDIWVAIKGHLEGDIRWSWVADLLENAENPADIIVEGVVVIPEIVNSFQSTAILQSILLVDKNEGRIKERIYSRGLWDDADKYPDELKEYELPWVLLYSHYIESEAAKYNLKTLEVGSKESLELMEGCVKEK
jgi:2-phosphoglycerate kinase